MYNKFYKRGLDNKKSSPQNEKIFQKDYYSALSIDACAAAKRAKGTRKGEHET